MKVPFLDLSREIIHIKDVVTNKMNTIIFDQTNFILGKELENRHRRPSLHHHY